MKETIRRSFDRVQLNEPDKKRLLDEILNKSEAARRSHSIRWIAGGAAALVAAAVLAVVLLGQKPGAMQAVVSEAPATVSGVASATEVSSSHAGFACSIVLSINPSVEFRLGDDGMVIEVVGLNEDGAALIDGIDFAGLSLENATIVVVNKLIEQGYISASMVDDVYISVTGSTQPDTLDMMSTIIKTAASQYELAVDTVQTGESELQVVLGDTDETAPEIIESLAPTSMPTVEPGATDNVQPTSTPAVTEEPSPTLTDLPPQVTRLEYTKESGSVGIIYITFEDGETVSNFLDSAGMNVNLATYWAVMLLEENDRFNNPIPASGVIFDLSEFDGDAVTGAFDLITLMVQEAGLSANITLTNKTITLTASVPAIERTASYTLYEISDPTVIKDRENITALQMQILSIVFTQEEIDYMLTPRYWAVMPNLTGLDEARAAELLALAGLIPVPCYEDGDNAESVDYGEVFYQDYGAGCLIEIGGGALFFVRAHSMPPVDLGNLPSDLMQYLPTFLGDTGHATVTVDRGTGMGVPISFRQEDYDVVIHAFGGGWKNADGSPRWNEQHIATNPDEVSVYWSADNGDGDDVPWRANLVYEIYRDGTYVASIAVNLTLVSSIEDETLTYEASVIAFGKDGPYSYTDLY